jgi:hypothetical protein
MNFASQKVIEALDNRAVTRPLTKGRIFQAFAVAIIFDALQFPANLAFFTGLFAIPAEVADVGLDVAASVLISRAIGFHWVFLPSFLMEAVPGLDLCPTWIASVAYVVWQRRRKEKSLRPPTSATVVEAPPAISERLLNNG